MFDLDSMLEIGVLTGSRAFNVHKEDSDWDILVSLNKAQLFALHNSIASYEVLVDFAEGDIQDNNSSETEDIDIESYMEAGFSVWGNDIIEIGKYQDLNGNLINLFIYPEKTNNLENMKKVVGILNFMHSRELVERDKRIELFIKYTSLYIENE